MERFTIQPIEESEAEKIIEFKNLYFHGQDPIEQALPGVKFTTDNTDLVIKAIRTGFAVKLVDNENGDLVGFVLGLPTDYTTRVEVFRNAAANAKDENTANILRAIGAIEEKGDINGRYPKEWTKIHARLLSVHPNYRGHKLGQRLLAAAIKEARKLKYDMITAICSSMYSSKIATGLGMELIATLTYQEFHESIGRQVFHPIEPHLDMRSFVLKL